MLKKCYLCNLSCDFVTGPCDQLDETSRVLMCNLIFFDTCKNKEDIENRKGDRV